MFKENNSRFSVLLDNNSLSTDNKKLNNNSSTTNINKERINRDNIYRKSSNFFTSKNDKEQTKKDFTFNEEMFPSLGGDETKEITPEIAKTQNFMEKLLTTQNNDLNNNIWVLPDGWVEITKDKQTSTLAYNYGKNMKPDKEMTIFDVAEELVTKYEKWEKEYIAKWGEDEYEKMYKFPNYDYYYFDDLDQKYYEESEDEYERDEEYTDIYDDYSDYY